MKATETLRRDIEHEVTQLQHYFTACYESYSRLAHLRGDGISALSAQFYAPPNLPEMIRIFDDMYRDIRHVGLRSDSGLDLPVLEAAREAWYSAREFIAAALPYNLLARSFNDLVESASPSHSYAPTMQYILDSAVLDGAPVRFIGITGPSCAGKSTALRAISTSYDFVYLPADHFFRKQAAEKIYGYDNWEIPASLMLDELYRSMMQLKRVEPTVIPSGMFTEDFSTLLYPGKVVVIDGFLLFTDPRIRELLDVRIFIDVAPEVQLERRILKTSEKRRDYILRVVIPQYEKHRSAIIKESHFILDGNADRDTVRGELKRAFRECGAFGGMGSTGEKS